MRVIISDTGPLNYLIQIDAISVIPALFGGIHVPPAVLAELNHKKSPASVRNWISALPSWIKITSSKQQLSFGQLGAGEVEALNLAGELRADLILLDDLTARQTAIALGFKTAGTLGLLAMAHKRGLLDFDNAVKKLLLTNYWVADEVINEIRAGLSK